MQIGATNEKDPDLDERAHEEITLMVSRGNYDDSGIAITAEEAWNALVNTYKNKELNCTIDSRKQNNLLL